MASRGLTTVSSMTLFSRVLGLARDAGMAVLFGAGPLLDAFSVAFRVPNMARRLFGEGALTAAFLPAYVRERESDAAAAGRLAWGSAIVLGVVLAVLTLLVETVLGLWWSSIDPGGLRTLLALTMILSPYVVWICVAAQLSAVLHAEGRFFLPALLPVVLNAVWLAALAITPSLVETPEARLKWVAAAVSASGVVQCGVTIWAVRRIGISAAELRPRWRETAARVAEIGRAMLPTVVGLSVLQMNSMLDSLLAWGLSPSAGFSQSLWWVDEGTATALYLGQRMYQFPLGVFGAALGTVLFPVLARHAQAGDRSALGRDLTRGIELSLLIGVPASLGLLMLAGPVVRLLFQHGEFDASDGVLTARMVGAYGLAVWAFIAMLIVNRGFYAVGDARTPMRAGLIGVAANVVLNAALLPTLGGVGLAAATGLATVLQLGISVRLLREKVADLDGRQVAKTGVRVALATSVMGIALLLLPSDDWGRVAALAGPVFVGAAVYAVASWAMGLSSVLKGSRL